MSYLADTWKALVTSMVNALRRPVTVQYPAEVRTRSERYRTTFALLHEENGDEACIGCLQCERICPSVVIAIKQAPKRESPFTGKKRGYAEDFTLDLEACIYCELCVQVCPTDAIVMCRTPETPGFFREDLVLTMDKLYANEKNRPASWGTGTRLMEMQDPARGKPPVEKPAKAAAKAAASGEAGATPVLAEAKGAGES